MKKTKLSEIKGEGTLSAFAAIIDPIFNLANDEDMMEMFLRRKQPAGMNDTEYLTRQACRVMAKREADFCAVMAVQYGCTAEEYKAGLTFEAAFADLSDLIRDEVWKGFFMPGLRRVMPFGAPQGNTADATTSAPSAATPAPAPGSGLN